MQGYEEKLRVKIAEFVASDSRNAMPAHGGMAIYGQPLTAFADASDPIFEQLKTAGVLGPQFIEPKGWFASAASVISYFLPFTEDVRASNRLPGMVSEEWASARIDGEAFNNALRLFVADFLRGEGYEAVAPAVDRRFRIAVPPDGGFAVSNWSERHVAYVAGLGTFGLHKGLITQKGCAGRFGSVVTSLPLEPTRRSYSGAFAYCPYLTDGKCGNCVARCPAQAISLLGKDKEICARYIDTEIKPRFAPRYGCAKCNTAVPCETGIPCL